MSSKDIIKLLTPQQIIGNDQWWKTPTGVTNYMLDYAGRILCGPTFSAKVCQTPLFCLVGIQPQHP